MRPLPLLNQEQSDRAPRNGIFLLYEGGQHYSSADREEERIVGVGTNPTQGRLRQRLRTHFPGSKHNSVFRLFVGTALLRCDKDPEDVHFEWFGNRSTMPEIERRVTAYLVEHVAFRCLLVENKPLRQRLEKGIIGTLANCPDCQPCGDWLGLHALGGDESRYGLWVGYRTGVTRTLDETGIEIWRGLAGH